MRSILEYPTSMGRETNQEKNDIIWWNYFDIYLFGLARLGLCYYIFYPPTVRPVIFCLISLPPILPSSRTIFSWDLLTVCTMCIFLSLSSFFRPATQPTLDFSVLFSFSNLLSLHSTNKSKFCFDQIEQTTQVCYILFSFYIFLFLCSLCRIF